MADDKEKPKSTPKKAPGNVFDVRRPGKALASPTSRPVILGHKPEAEASQTAVSGVGEANPVLTRRKIQIMPSGDIQAVEVGSDAKGEAPVADGAVDAQGTPVPEVERDALGTAAIDAASGPPELPKEEEDKPAAEKEERSRLFSKPKLVIQPPPEDAKPQEEVEAPSEAVSETEETPAPDETEKTEPEPEQPASDTPEEPAATEEPVPAEDGKSDTAETATEEPQKEEQKPEPHIEPLFDDHGVIVSHHDHRGHHGQGLKVFLLVLLILALAVVALDVLLDLGILTFEDIPHTDFLD